VKQNMTQRGELVRGGLRGEAAGVEEIWVMGEVIDLTTLNLQRSATNSWLSSSWVSWRVVIGSEAIHTFLAAPSMDERSRHRSLNPVTDSCCQGNDLNSLSIAHWFLNPQC
jgi:hypothetical protein